MSALKPAYVPVIDLGGSRERSATRFYLEDEAGMRTMDCTKALATRDREKAVRLVAGESGGRVIEWVLSDERINA